MGTTDDDFEVDAHALLDGASLGGDDLERDIRMPRRTATIAGAATNPLKPSVADSRTTPPSRADSGDSPPSARSTPSAAAIA